MKKLALILPLALVISFSFLPLAALAVGEACPSGNDGDCPGSEECDTSTLTCVAPDTGAGAGNVNTGGACTSDGQCSGNLACIHNICQIDPSLEDSGTAAAGGACNASDPNNGNSDCSGGQTCVNSVCSGATGNTPATPGAATGGSGTFTALAPIPGLTDSSTNTGNLAAFFNTLYKFCIGAAAVLAIIEITLGGLQVMSGDSVTAHSAGRDRIVGAILGLVLVLSPFLVFSIINPSILTFGAFSTDLKTLQPAAGTLSAPAAAAPSNTTDNGTTEVSNGAVINNYGTIACSSGDCTAAYGQQQSGGCSISDITLYCVPAQTPASQSVLDLQVTGVGNSINQKSPGCPSGQTPELACVTVNVSY